MIQNFTISLAHHSFSWLLIRYEFDAAASCGSYLVKGHKNWETDRKIKSELVFHFFGGHSWVWKDVMLLVRSCFDSGVYIHNSHQFKSNPNNIFNKLLPFVLRNRPECLSLEEVAITDQLSFPLAVTRFWSAETKQA